MSRCLIACEFSGIVRDAFAAKGWDSWSCDLLPTEKPGNHIQDDVLKHLDDGWDLMIGHPPCTFLALCQAWRCNRDKERAKQREIAVEFAKTLWISKIPRICLENPKSILTTRMCKKHQTIHPWQFGHGETKTTWLWLKNLPPLKPTNIVEGREQKIFKMSPGPNRSKDRSRTYPGIANAMAEQWGAL